ncbi:recombinase family protein, partial [Limosilactobacillus reuteri]|uniref:recombinase family protein n=1 Tax=Limosilactobacillus reuteri TaxID=1598 RepID=UPI00207CCFBE
CKEGIIPYHKDIKGNIFILDKITKMNDAIIYARVSNNNRKESLSEQQKFLETYASSKDYNIVGSFKELASGMNDDRKILSSILN